MPTFNYGASEIAHLKNRDPGLGAEINRIGWIEREVTPDLFAALIHRLAAQQISNAAAATIQAPAGRVARGRSRRGAWPKRRWPNCTPVVCPAARRRGFRAWASK